MPHKESEEELAAHIDDVIGWVYDVALDTEQYGKFLESWEKLNKPFGKRINAGKGGVEKPVVESHFQRAVAMLDQMADARNLDDVTALLAQFENVSAVVLGKGLTILGTNKAATQNFGIHPNSPLSSLSIEADDLLKLSKQVSDMLSKPDAKVSIFRVRTLISGSFLILQMRRTVLRSGDPVVVGVTSDILWPEGFKSVLNEVFNLSGTETEIVRLLVECCSVKEIAELRGRSIDTVRAQLKAILSKTEARSQTELVRLVLSMMDIAANTIDLQASPRNLSVGTYKLETLAIRTVYNDAGRRLDYLALGAPLGKPVLYITSEYGYARWTASAEEDAKRRGIKIISPHRAGYGESDPLPKNAPFCESIAQDFLTILDAEGIKNLPVVSLSDDHHFATQMEKIRPGTVTAIIATAGGLPFLNRAQVERLHTWYRFMQASARYTPHLFPYMVQMGRYWLLKQGRETFWNTIYADSPADLTTLKDPEVQEAMMVGSNNTVFGTYNGMDTFTRQTIFEQETWLIDHVKWLEEKMPVHFLLGSQDPAMPDVTIAEHKVEFPWIHFRIYEETGQLLLFKHSSDVLDVVESYL